jgi:hypothetical protein
MSYVPPAVVVEKTNSSSAVPIPPVAIVPAAPPEELTLSPAARAVPLPLTVSGPI